MEGVDLLRLFKCFDRYTIDNKNQVMAVFANNKFDAISKCAEIHKELDCYEDAYNSVLRDWRGEEYFVARDCDVYVCYPKHITHEKDVRLIAVPFHIQNVEEYVEEKLIEIESNESYFRDHVKDKAVNMSFNERFYFDSKGWVFESGHRLDIREDIKVKILEENKNISRFLDELWLENVNKFFNDNEEYRDLYIKYITTDAEPDILDDGFYFYVCEKVMKSREWCEYEEIRKVV